MLVLQEVPRKVSRAQETPFEIVSISTAASTNLWINDIIIMNFSILQWQNEIL